MRNKVLIIFLLLTTALISGVAGFRLGCKYTQKKINKYYSSIMFESSATDLKFKVKLLEHLKNNEVKKTENLLEFWVDTNLSFLSSYENISPKDRNKDIISAVMLAYVYRKNYPDHRVNPELSESVRRALNLAQ